MEDRGAPNPSQEIFWTLEVEEVAFGSALFCNSEVKKNNTDLRGGNRMMICVALTRQLISLNFTSKQWNMVTVPESSCRGESRGDVRKYFLNS